MKLLRQYALPALSLLLLVGLSLAVARAAQPVAALSPDVLVASVRSSSVFSLTNAEREAQAIRELQSNALLSEAAQLKAEDMAREGYYAHISPDGETPMHWLDVVGYRYLYVGENLTANVMSNERVIEVLMDSPGHRRNILDPRFTHLGIGVAEGTYKGAEALFVVQLFATPKPIIVPAPIPEKEAPPVAEPEPLPPVETTKEPPIGKELRELAEPLIRPLAGTTTLELFSGSTPVPLVLATSSATIELRSALTKPVPAPPVRTLLTSTPERPDTSWIQEGIEVAKGVVERLGQIIPF